MTANNRRSPNLAAGELARFSVPMSRVTTDDEKLDAYAAAFGLLAQLRARAFDLVTITAKLPATRLEMYRTQLAPMPEIRLWPTAEGIADAIGHLPAWKRTAIEFRFEAHDSDERLIEVAFISRAPVRNWRVPSAEVH